MRTEVRGGAWHTGTLPTWLGGAGVVGALWQTPSDPSGTPTDMRATKGDMFRRPYSSRGRRYGRPSLLSGSPNSQLGRAAAGRTEELV